MTIIDIKLAVQNVINYDYMKNVIIDRLSDKLSELLEDDGAHFVMQSGDGFCASYNETSNCSLSPDDTSALLSMTNKNDAYKFLDKKSKGL